MKEHKHCEKCYKALLVLAVCTFLCGCDGRPSRIVTGDALFCWQTEVVNRPLEEGIFDIMEEAGLTVLYQNISEDVEPDSLKAFLEEAYRRDIGVCLLTGAPQWGLDEGGEIMREEIARAVSYNSSLPREARLQGVLMDVEPYLTPEWEDSPKEVMDSYVRAMEQARRAAQDAGLQLIACIPYFYDSLGHEEALGQLIREGCDAVAVMNYQKNDEAGQIRTELALAEGKPFTVIYEMQPPGSHDLTEANTYYQEGLKGVAKSVDALREACGADGLSYAIHDYKILKELMRD